MRTIIHVLNGGVALMLMATMLARMPDLRSRVQAEHVPDQDGYCRDCRHARWPCELYQIASEAEQLGQQQMIPSARQVATSQVS